MSRVVTVAVRFMLFGATSIVSAVLATSPTVAQTPKHGGAIVEGLEADFPSLDVTRLSAFAEREPALSIYDPLFDVNANGEVVPYLAEGFTASSDAKVYTIKL